MEERRQDDTINRPQGERTIDAPFVTIDLPQYMDQIKSEKAWKESDHNAITVFKDKQLTVVLVAMRSKAEINAQRSEHLWSVQVLEGSVQLNIGENEVMLQKDQMAVVHAGMPYDLQAQEESLILLHVAGEGTEVESPY